MTSNLTVIPVADYEPPVGSPRPPSRPVTTARHPRPRLVAVPSAVEHPSARAAATFADAALRGMLEVIDGRRPFAQLQPLLADRIADSVIALARSPRRSADLAAQLRRVRVRVVDDDGDVAEVFATYCRGDRIRAIAARVEHAEVRGRRRWRLVALQMG